MSVWKLAWFNWMGLLEACALLSAFLVLNSPHVMHWHHPDIISVMKEQQETLYSLISDKGLAWAPLVWIHWFVSILNHYLCWGGCFHNWGFFFTIFNILTGSSCVLKVFLSGILTEECTLREVLVLFYILDVLLSQHSSDKAQVHGCLFY